LTIIDIVFDDSPQTLFQHGFWGYTANFWRFWRLLDAHRPIKLAGKPIVLVIAGAGDREFIGMWLGNRQWRFSIVKAAIDGGTAWCVRVSNYRQIVNAIFKLAVIRCRIVRRDRPQPTCTPAFSAFLLTQLLQRGWDSVSSREPERD